MKNITDVTEKTYEKNIGSLDIYKCYKKSPFSSIKHATYFHVYAELLEQFRDKPITFIEIGVLNGGSLFMWREYFGEKARIIGLDFNPQAKKWEEHGFEICIGNQADAKFWNELFQKIGDVDIVLDDGGHTYEQQIVTARECIHHIKDGGLLIVEDTITSYRREFGYPSKYTFIEWTKILIDCINSRSPSVKESLLSYQSSIHSISVYESIVSFKINREKCFENVTITNDGISSNAEDFRHKGAAIGQLHLAGDGVTTIIKKILPRAGQAHILKKLKNFVIESVTYVYRKLTLRQLKKYF